VLGSSVSAFVTVDANNYPLAVAVGLIDQRLPSPRRPTGQIGYVEWLATTIRTATEERPAWRCKSC